MSKISVFNCETQTEELRDMTIEEEKALKATQDSIADSRSKAENEKNAVYEKLAALGLTTDDLKALGL